MNFYGNITSKEEGLKLVDLIQTTYNNYKTEADPWRDLGQEDRQFRFGEQWTTEQAKDLKLRGMSPVVVNRIFPAVEMAKALLTANRPAFRVSPREDSDKKVADVFNGLLEYMYQISDGETVMRQIVDDYYVVGKGVGYVYQDTYADDGKGEVKIRDIDPFTAYFDPNAKGRFSEDSRWQFVSANYTKDQAIAMHMEYADLIDQANSAYDSDLPSSTLYDSGQLFFGDTFSPDVEYVRGYEAYHRESIPAFRVFETFSGKEEIVYQWDWEGYLNRIALMVEGQVYTELEDMLAIKEQINQMKAAYEQNVAQIQEKYQFALRDAELAKRERVAVMANQASTDELGAERLDIEAERAEMEFQMQAKQIEAQMQQEIAAITPPQEPQEVTFGDLLSMELIQSVRILTKRIVLDVVIGDKFLYRRILPTEHYPLVPFMNGYSRSPFPTSDVRQVKGLQQYVNKTRSLIMAYTANATNLKVFLPEGTTDVDEFEEKWNRAGMAAIEVDMEDGKVPIVPQLPPLPAGLFQTEQQAMHDIDNHIGLFELMAGNAQAAPPTYKATLAIDEFGQRRIRSKQMDIEAGIRQLARVAIPMMQELWTTEKIARVVQPNNSINEYTINKRMYDDKGAEIGVINDITRGKYDVIVVAGSTLPSNRFAQLEFYMDAYDRRIIDQQEVLKKTEVFDAEGVLQRTDTIAQLQQQLGQAQEEIKDLSGDIQTKDREISHLQKRVETEKFKSSMKAIETDVKASTHLYEARLADTLKSVKAETKATPAE